MPSLSIDHVLDALETRPGELWVLPQARAARYVREAFSARHSNRIADAAAPPSILSWTQWTSTLWNDLIVAGEETRLLLNAAQERTLWRSIVAEDGSTGLVSVDALADLAASGWTAATAWEATARLKSTASTHDTQVFAAWAETFSRHCGDKGYIAQAGLDAALRVHVERGTLPVAQKLNLLGFSDWTPARLSLLAALRRTGVAVDEHVLTCGERAQQRAVVAATEREELYLAARWVRQFLEAHAGARVAMVVPGLEKERAAVEDVLRDVLAPELHTVAADLSSTPWEIASGPPLGSLAIVVDALALAKWVEGALPIPDVSALLLSPYMGTQAERDGAAGIDARLLRRQLLLRPEADLPTLLGMLNGGHPGGEEHVLGWLHAVQRFAAAQGDTGRREAARRGFAEWMDFLRGLVRAAGWPGERPLTATEFAATEAWEGALDTVATLDFSGRRVSYSEALKALELQVARSRCATALQSASLHVLSVHDAEATKWDAVVFLRATDVHWPAAERAHPLLPWALQRSLKMPGTDSGATAERARRSMEALMQRSREVLFTLAAEDADGKLRPSPLIDATGTPVVTAEQLLGSTPETIPVKLENIAEDEPLPSLASSHVRGGSTVLKLQAACGFLAFAQLRLQATEPERGELGLDARESGSVLHRAMQSFWQQVKTQQRLREMSTHERDTLLTGAIEDALARRLRPRTGWDRSYVQVLKDRFLQVLRDWLDEELERGPFEVIAAEEDQQVQVGPLTLTVRMDRIDRVEGGFVLVDYKSGTAGEPKDWDGERPADAQLPLYALQYQSDELKGLLFAKVRAGKERKWIGVQAEPGVLPRAPRGKTHDLAGLVEQWRRTLPLLATQFAEGMADVRPRSYQIDCARCGQRLLCRVDPFSLVDSAAEEEMEDVDG